jgi:hypothetical protein
MMKTAAYGHQASFKLPDLNIMNPFALWDMTIDSIEVSKWEKRIFSLLFS